MVATGLPTNCIQRTGGQQEQLRDCSGVQRADQAMTDRSSESIVLDYFSRWCDIKSVSEMRLTISLPRSRQPKV